MSSGSGYPTPPSTRRSGQKSDEYESCNGPFGVSNRLYRVGAPPLLPLPLIGRRDAIVVDLETRFSGQFDRKVYDVLTENGIINQDFGEQGWSDDMSSSDDHHRKLTSWSIEARSSYADPDRAVHTLLIHSYWKRDSPTTWENAVVELKRWFDKLLADNNVTMVDFHIEMIASEIFEKRFFSSIDNRPDLDRDWNHIKQQVRQLLFKYPQLEESWTCVALLRCGRNPSRTENPATVYIAFDHSSDEILWVPFRQDLGSLLASMPHNLEFWLEHCATGFLGKFELLYDICTPTKDKVYWDVETLYKQKANMGDSISAATYNFMEQEDEKGEQLAPKKVCSTVGTLGCYVEIQQTKDGAWEKLILTNYHVVRPAIDGFKRNKTKGIVTPDPASALYKADHEGFKSETAPATKMETPPRVEHNKALAWHGNKMTMINSEEDKNELQIMIDDKIAFFDDEKHILGSLYAGSGFKFRTKTNGMLDWALIKPDSARIGDNTLPSISRWPARNSRFQDAPPATLKDIKLKEHLPAQFSVPVQKDPEAEGRVNDLATHAYVSGAFTYAATGSFLTHEPDVSYTDWKYMTKEGVPKTTEHAFICHYTSVQSIQRLGQEGDSGSVVWDGEGHPLGLLFRGQISEHKHDLTFVTPMEYIFDHIKAFLGAEAVRIAQ